MNISIHHRLAIEVPAEKIYNALTTQQGLSAWWTPETTAKPEAGTISTFAFGTDYVKEMKIEELDPFSSVKWRCHNGYKEWIGTTVSFELQPRDRGTLLFLHHDGWQNYTEGFAACSYDWAMFLRSLRLFCETGKGLPYPNQYK